MKNQRVALPSNHRIMNDLFSVTCEVEFATDMVKKGHEDFCI